MARKKSSWEYQKGKYNQINLKFNMFDQDDLKLYYYLTCKEVNASRLLKQLLRDHIQREEDGDA